MAEGFFFGLPDDVVINVFLRLDGDPRDWARLACVCTRFLSLMHNVCWKNKCSQTIPSVLSDLLSSSVASSDPPGGWAALYKLSFCCPGLLHAGVLLENSDFGLERELGPDENYRQTGLTTHNREEPVASSSTHQVTSPANGIHSDCSWSLFDDLYFDTVYDASESRDGSVKTEAEDETVMGIEVGRDFSVSKKRKMGRSIEAHLASGVWNLSREEGNKLLGSRFRGDCLYICDFPGCVHNEEKRDYMLFRGIFKNFRRSRVWRTINDGNTDRSRIALDCAFCSCRETWDLHSAFCLKRVFGFHDDGEPVVRAYVCKNGHVSGAWTKRPMYT